MQAVTRAVALLHRAGDAQLLLLHVLVQTAEAVGAQVRGLVAGLGLHHKALLVLVHVVHRVPGSVTATRTGVASQFLSQLPDVGVWTKDDLHIFFQSIPQVAGSRSGNPNLHKRRHKLCGSFNTATYLIIL